MITQEAGIDARLGEIGAAIQETMESYEVVVNGETKPGKKFCHVFAVDYRLMFTQSR